MRLTGMPDVSAALALPPTASICRPASIRYRKIAIRMITTTVTTDIRGTNSQRACPIAL